MPRKWMKRDMYHIVRDLAEDTTVKVTVFEDRGTAWSTRAWNERTCFGLEDLRDPSSADALYRRSSRLPSHHVNHRSRSALRQVQPGLESLRLSGHLRNPRAPRNTEVQGRECSRLGMAGPGGYVERPRCRLSDEGVSQWFSEDRREGGPSREVLGDDHGSFGTVIHIPGHMFVNGGSRREGEARIQAVSCCDITMLNLWHILHNVLQPMDT
ncbi:hypothetical protein GY45DRAFT_863916 [Cubamyces sp. BRFM 1775]|nr:hypothetical protein GY45DRAFT_863916 [Cubamyces sp. BRFM 1775]